MCQHQYHHEGHRTYGANIPGFAQGAFFPGEQPGPRCNLTGGEPCTNPRGDTYYWMDGELQITGDTEGTDIQALADGWVSLTPIGFDLTHEAGLKHLNTWPLGPV